jgi:hypothetical protein
MYRALATGSLTMAIRFLAGGVVDLIVAAAPGNIVWLEKQSTCQQWIAKVFSNS